MPSQSSSARHTGTFSFRRPEYPSPNMRVSDAERSAVADRLARHYGDGRLDQAEFNSRLDQAMHAKTYADLSGLFADLPPDDDAEPEPLPRPSRSDFGPPGQRSRRFRGLVPIAVVIVVALIAGNVVGHLVAPMHWVFAPWFWFNPFAWFGPWLWIGLIAFLVLRHRDRRRRRY